MASSKNLYKNAYLFTCLFSLAYLHHPWECAFMLCKLSLLTQNNLSDQLWVPKNVVWPQERIIEKILILGLTSLWDQNNVQPKEGILGRSDLLRALDSGQLGRNRNDESQMSIFTPVVPGICSFLFLLLLFPNKVYRVLLMCQQQAKFGIWWHECRCSISLYGASDPNVRNRYLNNHTD